MSSEIDKHSAQKKVSLIAADQALSTSINFVILFTCMRFLEINAFGRFSFAWGIISTFVIFSRAIFGTPVVLDNFENNSNNTNLNGSLIGAFALGILASFTILVLNTTQGFALKNDWVLAVVLLSPLILSHDQLRFTSVSRDQPRVALFIDLTLFSAATLASIAMFASKTIDTRLPILLLLGYSVSVFVGMRRLSLRFDPKSLQEIISKDFRRRGLLLVDASLVLLFGILSLFLMRQASGDEGVGLYSFLALVFVPVTLVSVFMMLGVQKEVSRTRGNLSARHRIYLVLLCLSPMPWGVALSVFPDELSLLIFGGNMVEGLVFVAAYAASSSLFLLLEMLNLFLKSDSRFTEIVKIRLVSGICLVALLTIGGFKHFSMTYLIGSFGASSFIGICATLIVLTNKKKLKFTPLNK